MKVKVKEKSYENIRQNLHGWALGSDMGTADLMMAPNEITKRQCLMKLKKC